MVGHWHWASGIDSAGFSYLFVRSAKTRGRPEIRPSVPGFSASNPEQSWKFHSRSRKRNRVEGIRNIDKRAGFLSFGGLRQQRESEARSPGGSGAAQFHERTARKSTTEHRIEVRNSARLELDGSAVLKSFKSSSDETCFEFSLLQRSGRHRCMLAFSSPIGKILFS